MRKGILTTQVKYNNEQAVNTPFNHSLFWTFIPLVNATAQIEHDDCSTRI